MFTSLYDSDVLCRYLAHHEPENKNISVNNQNVIAIHVILYYNYNIIINIICYHFGYWYHYPPNRML